MPPSARALPSLPSRSCAPTASWQRRVSSLRTSPISARRPPSIATTGAHQVISASLSSSLTGLMQHVVTAVPSYNQATYIPGYTVGGKTGTAQIWEPDAQQGKGGWMDNIYNYSFYGWVGQSAPDLAIGAVIYQGTRRRWPRASWPCPSSRPSSSGG